METVWSTERYRPIRQILNTELNSKNKVTAINTAVPVIIYSFGIVDWLKTEIEKIYRKTRKLLTMGVCITLKPMFLDCILKGETEDVA